MDNCKCDALPYGIILIDKNIQEHVRVLNKKGYRTINCCEGHRTDCINTYIEFANDYFNDIETPSGFTYNKRRRIITYTYSYKLTENEMEEMKEKKLAELLEWCKSLPNRNAER